MESLRKWSAWSNTPYDGCNDLDQHDKETWFSLGGIDVVCWGNNVTIVAKSQAAVDYLVSVYGWESVEEIAD